MFPHIFPVVLILLVCMWSAVVHAERKMNITHFDNCEDFGLSAKLHVTQVNFDVDPVSGLVDKIHGTYRIKAADTSHKLLRMTVFSCGMDSPSPCKDNPQTTEVDMSCERFVTDTSGPWHAQSKAMTEGVCGDVVGEHPYMYDTLEQTHMEDYVDLNDPQLARFSFRTMFINTEDNSVWNCGYISVDLVDV